MAADQANGEFLVQAATYLGAAAIAVPLFNRLKLGSILGYLAAGVVIGPHALNLLRHEEGVFHVAEFGVVLFLFVIGLELSLARLWAMRRSIFGLGLAQMVVTGFLIAAAFVFMDVMPAPAAAIAGLSLAFSSTALAMQLIKDRGESGSKYAGRAFPILLFQDLAVIPLLAAIPVVAGEMIAEDDQSASLAAAKAIGVIAALVLSGRFLLNPLLRIAASSGSREAFAAIALFIVAGTSLLVDWAGLSMALGAFLAGVMLAESAYKHQVETDIEPFRGLLLGLFFISIGMRLELPVIMANWPLVLGGAIGLVAVKAVVVYGLARAFKADHREAAKAGAVVSQGGEFAFVVFSLGVASALFTNEQATLMSAIVTLSMALTPGLLILIDRLTRRKGAGAEGLDGPSADSDHVIIVGFGRVGQIISQVLMNSGVKVTAIDRNPDHIRNAERFGFKVYYGDGGRFDTLFTAGILECRGVILTMDDRDAVNRAVEGVRAWSPGLPVFVVAHDRLHEIAVRPLGPDVVVRETLESSLLMAREVLRKLAFADAVIDDYIEEFRRRDRERLLAQIDEGPEAGAHLIHQPFGAPKDPR
jgi:monovalent cation:proton antiporter-2 (CPA2) family protein